MARKLFISFLGTGNYKACHYERGSYLSDSMRFIQVATLEYLEHTGEWDKTNANDRIIILTTKGADGSEIKNWLDDGQKDSKTQAVIKQPGLESELNSAGFKPQTSRIDVPDGSNDGDILKIFETVYSLLNEGDEVYFDSTHAFRYLPMLMLVMFNYAKFLKGVTVRSITYGNWDGRNQETNVGKIVDLTQYSTLQDWTSAAASFINSGNADQLKSLTESSNVSENVKEVVSTLNDIALDMQTCRGKNILSGENFKALESQAEGLDVNLPQLKEILNKVKEQFAEFEGRESAKNGFKAAKWCIDHNLFQQAVTILQEACVSFFQMKHSNSLPNLELEGQRKFVQDALIVVKRKWINEEEKWKVKDELRPLFKDFLPIIAADNEKYIFINQYGGKKRISELYYSLSEIRNDFNHFGMRKRPNEAEDIKKNIADKYHEIYAALYGNV